MPYLVGGSFKKGGIVAQAVVTFMCGIAIPLVPFTVLIKKHEMSLAFRILTIFYIYRVGDVCTARDYDGRHKVPATASPDHGS